VKRPGFELIGLNGETMGHVEAVWYGLRSVQVDGWTRSDQVSLASAGSFDWAKPDKPRRDVQDVLGPDTPAQCGFSRQAVGQPDRMMCAIRKDNSLICVRVPVLPNHIARHARLRLMVQFLRDLMVGAPSLVKYLLRRTTANRQTAKRALRMTTPSDGKVFDESILATNAPLPTTKITIVIPVYNALDQLRECLRRVEAHTQVPWRMVLVEDKSTDAAVRPFVQKWAARICANGHDVQLILNDDNLGFVGSVNKALEAALRHGDHVVLLNSDAFVPDKWAQRLLAPIIGNDKVASVTPMSNDAELQTIPAISKPNPLPQHAVDQIDHAVAHIIDPAAVVQVPTGVGFCMAMNKTFLHKVPQLDHAFGKGYGEEVDWCQKVQKAGGLHVAQPALFVEHVGAASFLPDRKIKAITKSNALIASRYPDFNSDVQEFIGNDPLRDARIIHAISMSAATQPRLKVFIGHSMGGGAEIYLKSRLEQLCAKGEAAVVLRVGGPSLWQVEHHSAHGVLTTRVASNQVVMRLLNVFCSLEIIYSCGVGHLRPEELPSCLATLAEIEGNTLEILMHDYFCISEAYTLLSRDGHFTGISPLGDVDKIWRHAWRRALVRSQRITCFSDSSRRLVCDAFPDLSDRVLVQPHSVAEIPQLTGPGPYGAIGILGDIGYQKGATLVSRMTRTFSGSNERNIVVVGRIDPSFVLGPKGAQTGRYERSEISDIAADNQLSCWLIPSIWPETFSYTTHEAIATGLPVFTFDLGAQSEAARAASNGHVMPLAWAADPKKVSTFIDGVLKNGAERRSIDKRSEGRRRRGFAA